MLKDIIKRKCSNIGSLTSYIKKRPLLLKELNSYFINFKWYETLTIPQMCWYLYNNIKKEQLCICGKHKKWYYFKIGWRKTCGDKKCFVKIRKETNIKKWGVDNPQKNKEIKEKTEKTNLEKWGVKNPSKNKKIKKKISNSKLNKTKEEKEIRNKKFLKTWDKCDKEKIKKKKENTWKQKTKKEKEYISNKRKRTLIKNTGYPFTFYSPKTKEKIKNKNLQKYGYSHHFKNEEIQNKRIISYKKRLKKKLKNIINSKDFTYIDHYINDYNTIFVKYKHSCNHITNISYSSFKKRIKENKLFCSKCYKIFGTSRKELEILNFIKSIYKNKVIHRFKLKKDLELDIYLPNKKIAFEFNGLWWHSEKFKTKWYHYNKSKECEKRGIKLFHIWENWWDLKKDIVKYKIKSLVDKCIELKYSKFEIKEISKFNNEKFLNENSIFDFENFNINLGLYSNSILCGVLNISENENYIIKNYCFKNGIIIKEGLNLFIKYFIENYSNKVKIILNNDWLDIDLDIRNDFVFNKNLSYINYKNIKIWNSGYKTKTF